MIEGGGNLVDMLQICWQKGIKTYSFSTGDRHALRPMAEVAGNPYHLRKETLNFFLIFSHSRILLPLLYSTEPATLLPFFKTVPHLFMIWLRSSRLTWATGYARFFHSYGQQASMMALDVKVSSGL